ncbi:uncharacterized protein LOC119068449 [Bradysia coprophila]|uniref:uncharacterized protein LOC119068449 n=1 Tax=Bradysia coprophila TaxID=38358 RepID=UPI00187D96D0|nr:uncharacterized protein LOC119068449 [Bradysia coprophila]
MINHFTMAEEKPPHSFICNYMKLHGLLNDIAVPFLAGLVIDLWRIKYHRIWVNMDIQGAEFTTNIGSTVYNKARPLQKALLRTGDVQKWDLRLLVDALKCYETDTVKSQEQQNAYQKLKQIHNEICYERQCIVNDNLFKKLWAETSEILISLGVKPRDVERVKKFTLDANKASIEKAADLMAIGDSLVKDEQFDRAVETYARAISLPGLPAVELGTLYLHRSFAYLKWGFYYHAKDDAICATLLRPAWDLAYFRLGKTYDSVQKLKEAADNYAKSKALNPKQKIPEISEPAPLTVEEIASHTTLDEDGNPIFSKAAIAAPNTRSNTTNLPAEIAIRTKQDEDGNHIFSAALIAELNKRNNTTNFPAGMCAEAHKYLNGTGVEKNYEKAVYWFSKAAAVDNAEGLYYLGILTKQGIGISQNLSAGIKNVMQAASQDISIDLMGTKILNVGVADAQHSFALLYMDGIGVKQDPRKAIAWYLKAIRHGSGASANNIGKMYCDGYGVVRNAEMGLNYYKLGALLKTVRAMENVFDIYIKKLDIGNALNWFKFAVSRGSMYLAERTDKLRDLLGNQIDAPFDEEQFEKDLRTEMEVGPLASLIPKDLPPSIEDILTSPNATCRAQLGLGDRYRMSIVTAHRRELKLVKNASLKLDRTTNKELPKTKVDLSTLKKISLSDMGEERQDGSAMKITFIEDAILGRPTIVQIAEDENGDAQRIFIDNFPQNEETHKHIGYGCQVTLLNPHYETDPDGKPVIRVNSNLLVLHPTDDGQSRCRYCTRLGAAIPCRKCKRVFYCSKSCSMIDSVELNHKDVCFKRW